MSSAKLRGPFLGLLLMTLGWVGCGEEPTRPPPPLGDFLSDFKAGDDGWTAWNFVPIPVHWEHDAGRPDGTGGCISITGEGMAFRAPSELGNGADLSGHYGKQLTYWMRVSGGASWRAQAGHWNVSIVSTENRQLSIAVPEAVQVDLAYRWQPVALNLSAEPSELRGREAVWQIDGHSASEAEIREILSSVQHLFIWADFKTGDHTTYLDDVTIAPAGEPEGPDDRVCNGLPYMCEMPFDRIVLPGNHNAGAKGLMYCSIGTPVSACFYNNQGTEITSQLDYGIRYFDIDIGGCRNTLHTVHGSDTRGRTIDYIMDEFESFLNAPSHRNEVVVITVGDIIGNIGPLQHSFFGRLARFVATPERLANGELTIFAKPPGDPWPTLAYLVDTNQRIVVFVRNASAELQSIGVLDEREHIHDTWRSRSCTSSCAGVVQRYV